MNTIHITLNDFCREELSDISHPSSDKKIKKIANTEILFDDRIHHISFAEKSSRIYVHCFLDEIAYSSLEIVIPT